MALTAGLRRQGRPSIDKTVRWRDRNLRLGIREAGTREVWAGQD